jgi:hypothetical protein
MIDPNPTEAVSIYSSEYPKLTMLVTHALERGASRALRRAFGNGLNFHVAYFREHGTGRS